MAFRFQALPNRSYHVVNGSGASVRKTPIIGIAACFAQAKSGHA
jgi:hypothetical protein